MTLDEAVAILNDNKHRDWSDWKVIGSRRLTSVDPGRLTDFVEGYYEAYEDGKFTMRCHLLTGFEAIAIAREYERQANKIGHIHVCRICGKEDDPCYKDDCLPFGEWEHSWHPQSRKDKGDNRHARAADKYRRKAEVPE